MSRAQVVIGAMFGDEGKGLMTDFFSDKDTTVVRFNGGAQAGHTVVTPNGKRHVFSHFGSGTYRGAKTYLSKHFLVNPISFYSELPELPTSVNTPIQIHPSARVTTPYDMIINQLVAKSDSCGMGIHETMVRSERKFSRFRAEDLISESRTVKMLLWVREYWVSKRLEELGITEIPDDLAYTLESDSTLDWFMDARKAMLEYVEFTKQPTGKLVFEGAQGLALDEEHQFFPFVTHSRTGLPNVVECAKEWGIDTLDVCYVTRAYSTRHGAGPFPTEESGLIYHDDTNVPNPFQGTLRFGILDIDLLRSNIFDDMDKNHGGLNILPSLAITHLDQVGDHIRLKRDGQLISTRSQDLDWFFSNWPMNQIYHVDGLTREHVHAMF